jgi:hypothetical protein
MGIAPGMAQVTLFYSCPFPLRKAKYYGIRNTSLIVAETFVNFNR